MRLAALAFAVSTAWPIATTAQVRDARPAVQAGTATIRGRVIAADGSRPLRRVQIRGTAPELTGPGSTTSTDEDGRYELTNLPAGRYTVTATRAGFLPLRFGQRRPRELGRAVTVSGTAHNAQGKPFRSVSLRLEIRSEGGGLFGTAGDVRTGADGSFIFRDVAPGDYVLVATEQDPPQMASLPIVADGAD